MKEVIEELKNIWNYIRFADMGAMGEGCLLSVFIWIVIIVISGAILGAVLN
jgi:hypothetical protein